MYTGTRWMLATIRFYSQLEGLVKGGIECVLDDLRLLHRLLAEHVAGTQLDQHKRVTQTCKHIYTQYNVADWLSRLVFN